jgi:hypothetical protein
MALTFWAELYFRSLKRTSVLPLLTKYLIQYKRVCIPYIGTFEIVQQSPRLNIADKLFTPPGFTTLYRRQDAVSDHQFHYIAIASKEEKEKLQEELSLFGQKLQQKIQHTPFSWKGFGTLSYSANELVFEPQEMQLESLQRVPADKVIRKNEAHQMLVGDREMNSHEAAEGIHTRRVTYPVYLILGWVILLLAIATIAYFLYLNRFEPSGAGLKLPLKGFY